MTVVELYGDEVPGLEMVASEVLSQVSSACSYERNWSGYSFIPSKRRNRRNQCLVSKMRDLNYSEEVLPWDEVSSREEGSSSSGSEEDGSSSEETGSSSEEEGGSQAGRGEEAAEGEAINQQQQKRNREEQQLPGGSRTLSTA
jgi:hypothetical protein